MPAYLRKRSFPGPVIRTIAPLLLFAAILASCAGPSVAEPVLGTATVSPTITVIAPTAAVGQTTGAPCESGTLHIKDLRAMQDRLAAGLDAAQATALGWQTDAFLVELDVSCELFESGFRWQATFYSVTAQSYFRADTTEVIPANADPASIVPLPQAGLDFARLMGVLLADPTLALRTDYVVTGLNVTVKTETRPFGPAKVPTGPAIYHVTVQTPGQLRELYVDARAGTIYQFQS